ncbi:MAG: hypothetical protein ACI31M_01075 [Bacilli bacterium]
MKVNISNNTVTKERFIEKGKYITCDNIICFNNDDCEECIFYEKAYDLKDLLSTNRICASDK